MVGLKTTERKKTPAVPDLDAPLSEAAVKRQLSLAAGTEAFRDRDPIYHLTESFRETFDQSGMTRARGGTPDLGAMTERYSMPQGPGMADPGGSPLLGETEPSGEQADRRKDMSPYYQPRDPQRTALERFGEVAFQRGTLSAAVLRGQGKMMLFSCLKRTAGQDKSLLLRERKLFQAGSSHRHIPGRQGDLAVVNKGFVNSAVGLVVDATKDARQALDSFTALAEGKAGAAGRGSIEKQYPFLTDRRERALLAEYQARLALLQGPGHEEERAILIRAQEKAQAIIQKKEQMKRDFLQKLRWLSYCAAEAEAEFLGLRSQDEFRPAEGPGPETPETPPPPKDGPPGDGKPRRRKARTPQKGGGDAPPETPPP